MKKRISLALPSILLAMLLTGIGGGTSAEVSREAVRVLAREDVMNILMGCAILGTGGGGTLDDGVRNIDEALAAGKQFRLVDIDALDPDTLIGTPYICGSVSPLTEEEAEKYARLTEAKENIYFLNVEQMEEYLGRDVAAFTATELGAESTATAFYVAAMTDSLIVDADPAGRSAPSLQQSTYNLKDIPSCPIAVMNVFGEGAIFTRVFDDERADELVRALAVVSRDDIAVVDHVNTAAVLRDAVIHGTISHAERLGRAFCEARDSGEDYVAAVLEAGGGRQMFQGVVTNSHFETRDGFTLGETVLEGEGDFEGHSLCIWYKNENIISWLDDAPYVTVPDLICVFDLDRAMPQFNPEARVGEHAAVIALPAPEAWTTPRGLELIGPRSFGFDIDYSPFC